MNGEAVKNPVTLESISASIELMSESIDSLSSRMNIRIAAVETRLNGITLSVDDLPTRKELNVLLDELEKRLETQIDDLAVSVNSEFKRIHIRLDKMDDHIVEFEKNDQYLDKRLKKLETVMFTH